MAARFKSSTQISWPEMNASFRPSGEGKRYEYRPGVSSSYDLTRSSIHAIVRSGGHGVAAQVDECSVVREVEMRCPIGDIIRDVVYDRHGHTAGFEGVDVEWHGEACSCGRR